MNIKITTEDTEITEFIFGGVLCPPAYGGLIILFIL
jgi:hypothetical protein